MCEKYLPKRWTLKEKTAPGIYRPYTSCSCLGVCGSVLGGGIESECSREGLSQVNRRGQMKNNRRQLFNRKPAQSRQWKPDRHNLLQPAAPNGSHRRKCWVTAWGKGLFVMYGRARQQFSLNKDRNLQSVEQEGRDWQARVLHAFQRQPKGN